MADVPEASGFASVADGGTVAHGFGRVPGKVFVEPTVAGTMHAVTAKTATTFTVALKTVTLGSVVAGSTQTVYWLVK